MIERVTTEGVFALDGGEWAVTNNVWLIGNDREVIVIDAAHDASPIVTAHCPTARGMPGNLRAFAPAHRPALRVGGNWLAVPWEAGLQQTLQTWRHS